MSLRARHNRRAAGLLAVLMAMLGVLTYTATQALAVEAPITSPATEVTATTAILHGELNPHSTPGEAYEWLFGIAPATSSCLEQKLFPEPFGVGLGIEREAVEAEATGLQPNHDYTFCLVALAGSGLAEGMPVALKTLGSKPTLVGGASKASGVSPFAATLEALVNPNNEETSFAVEYAENEALTGAKTLVGTPLPAEYGELTASVNTGKVLTAATTYYFRVIAKNATGSVEGPVESFTTSTAETPIVDSEAVAALNTAEPKLEATVNPNFQETSYRFEYSTEASGETLEGPIVTIDGAPPAALLPDVFEELEAGPVGLHGLSPGPTYYYRVVASNATGTTDGPVQSFQALAEPAVSAGSAQDVTRTTALVSASVTPQGLPTGYHFAYIPQAAYEAALAEGASNPYAAGHSTYQTKLGETDYEPHAVRLIVEELVPGTTYHYAVVASNELGETIGPDATFTTSAPTAPTAVTGGTTGVSQLSATILGSVDAHGLPVSTEFEFGASPYSGTLLPASITSSSGTVLSLSASFSGSLLAGTVYYYRTVASNQDGTGYGSEQSFTTGSFPAVLAIPPNPAAVPYATIAELDKQEAKETPKPPKPLTRAQKLAKALKGCAKRPKKQRASCRTKAEHQYGPMKKATAKHK